MAKSAATPETRARARTATPRMRVKRLPDRGWYDRETIDPILDEALVCHLGFVHEGQPFVIPTLHARIGDQLYLHGSAASRALAAAGSGLPVCVTATLIDGIVFAVSLFNHSVNYRSVVVLGEAVAVTDPADKLRALEAFTEKLVPGRWAEARQPTKQELKATSVLVLPLREVSAKIRTGDPGDVDTQTPEEQIWAGVVPLALRSSAPVPAAALEGDIPVPESVRALARRFAGR